MTCASSSPSPPRYCPRSCPVSPISGPPAPSPVSPTVCRSWVSRVTSKRRSAGQGCLASGQAKCTYGTGAFLLVHTGPQLIPSTRGLVTTIAASLGNAPPQYALEGSVFIAGAAVQWFRDGLKAVGAAPEVDRLCEQADPDSGVLFVPALTGLGSAALGARGPRDVVRPDPRHVDRRPCPRPRSKGSPSRSAT